MCGCNSSCLLHFHHRRTFSSYKTTDVTTVMQIQLLSDLHLEVNRPEEPSYSYNFPAHAKVLALLGDIGCAVHDELFTWLRCQLQRFVLVFFVMGNHGKSPCHCRQTFH